MKTASIYNCAINNGCYLESTCVDISITQWDHLMKGHTRANRKMAVELAIQTGTITEEYGKRELKNAWFNPYKHYKTKTHIIYVNSGIEYFIKVN